MFPVPPIHLFRCAALAAAVLTAGCGKSDDNVAWWQGEQERIELSHRLALKEFRFEQLGSKDLPELDRLRRSNQTQAVSLKSLKQRHSALNEEFETLQRQSAGFREAVIRDQRNRAIGRTFTELASLSGRTYKDVTIASIDDAGVAIRHADGSARLRYADLDSDQRLFFGLEADLALAAVERESRDVAAYERWIDGQMAVLQERNAEQAGIAMRNEQKARNNRAMQAARQTVASNVSPLARPATSFGSGSSRYYSTYRAYRPTYRYVYYTPAFPRSCYPYGRQSASRYYTPVVIQNRRFPNNTIPSAQ